MNKNILLFLFLLIFSVNVQAADIYIMEGGSGNGSSWSSAFDDFSGITWSTLSAGDTVWVATGTYGSISPSKGGTDGNRLIIKRATEADHGTETGWDNAYDGLVTINGAISFGDDDGGITVDGVTEYGIKVNITGAAGININAAVDNITLQYIEIDGTNGPCPSRGVRAYNYDADGYSTNVKFRYMYIHDTSNDAFALYDFDQYWIEHCVIGPFSSCDDTHKDGIESERGGSIVIRWNTWNWYADNIQTGMGVGDGKPSGPWYIYGNTFDRCSSCYKTNSKNPEGHGPIYFFNNVVANTSGDAVFGRGNEQLTVYNTIYRNNSSDGTTGIDYYVDGDDPFVDFSGKNFRLDSGASGCIDAGTDITGLLWWSETYISALDADGTTMGADGAWDIGAFEYDEGGGTPTTTTITGIEIR